MKIIGFTILSFVVALGNELALGSLYDGVPSWDSAFHHLWPILHLLFPALIIVGISYLMGVWRFNVLWRVYAVVLSVIVPQLTSVMNFYFSCYFFHACL